MCSGVACWAGGVVYFLGFVGKEGKNLAWLGWLGGLVRWLVRGVVG